jgi:hypothetical protein
LRSQQKKEDDKEVKVKISVDLDKASLTQFLEFKEIISVNRGSTEVEVCFLSQGTEMAKLFLDKKRYINYKDSLLKKIGELSSFEVETINS